MINIQTIQHVADCVPLYLPHSLYLKPVARMNISVTLPSIKTGKSISNLDIMEKLSNAMKPDKFLVLKVLKSTIDYIRFEAELDERTRLRNAINRLDGISLKLNGFNESFRVRACEPKDEFPTRHDWDSFFRDANNMDEMKAGERPDTIHFTHLPIKWFCPRHLENEENVKPSESIFKRIFEKYGSVRCVDIPICDPFRNKMNSDINGMKTFSYEQDVLFEAYVQFDEYVGFVRAMDEFRGMKLVRKFLDKTQAINITVNFDTTKHLSDAQMQRRERVRKRLIAKAQAEEDDKERQKQLEQERLERERQKEEQAKLAELEKQREREERRKEKHLKKIQEKGQVEISQKIRVEERKLMIAQRKLESIRILEQLFDRLKLKHLAKYGCNSHKYQMEQQRDGTRERLVLKYKTATEKLLLDQRRKVDEIKSKTPLMGLLSRKKFTNKHEYDESDDEKSSKLGTNAIKIENSDATQSIQNAAAATINTGTEKLPLNPFKVVSGGITPLHNPYSSEAAAASEWMKSLMFPYVSPMFAGMPHLYRPPPPAFPISSNYRGFNPRIMRGGRGRGRGGGTIRGRGSYDGQASSYYNNNNYKHYNNHNDGDEDNDGSGGNHYHHKYYKNRNRSRSRTRSRSKRRSRTRSRTRSRSRSRHRHYSKRTRTRSRTRSYTHSRSRSKSRIKSRDDKRRSRTPSQSGNQLAKPPEKINKKLASTRRSHSYSSSSSTSSRSSRTTSRTRSRSRKRTHSRSRSRSSRAKNKTYSSGSRNHSVRKRKSKRSWSHRRGGSHSRSHSRSSTGGGGSTPNRQLVIDSEQLVRSAEEIKRTIEKDMQERMREEEREIKQTFNKRQKRTNSIQHIVTATKTSIINEHLTTTDSSISGAKTVESNRAITTSSTSPITTLPTSPHNSKESDHRNYGIEEKGRENYDEDEDQQVKHHRRRRRHSRNSSRSRSRSCSRSSSHHPADQLSEPEGGDISF